MALTLMLCNKKVLSEQNNLQYYQYVQAVSVHCVNF